MQKTITHLNFAKGFRGGERQTQLLIEQLSKTNGKQTLIVRKKSELGKRCKDIPNVTVYEISKPYFLFLSHVKNAPILHAHETKAAQFAFLAHRRYGIPYIITRRVDNPIKNNYFNRLIYSSAFCNAALSQAIKNEILTVAPQSRIEIIPSAYSEFIPDQEKIGIIRKRFEGKYLIGHVGALDDRHKGQSTIIETAKLVEKQYPDFHFLLVGGGADESMLKNKAIGLKNVSFEGFVNNVGDYLAALDLFVFPSNNEGLGSILFDAMQAKVPIIASNVGGIPDIITNETNGLLIPPRDPKALVAAIQKVYNDKLMQKQLVTNGTERLSSYSPQMMAQRYKILYSPIIQWP